MFLFSDDPVWTQELDIDPPINDTDDDYNFHTQGKSPHTIYHYIPI